MKCNQCGFENPEASGYCSACGAPLNNPTQQNGYNEQPNYSQPNYSQPYNGQPNYGQPNYSQPYNGQPNYGQPNYSQPYNGQPNYAQQNYVQPVGLVSPCNRWVAFLLCFFLGAIGIHRFYVGKVGTGILYIFTVGLFGIGVLVDLIMIACGSFTDKSGAFLKH